MLRAQKGRRVGRKVDPRQGDFLTLLEGAIPLPAAPAPDSTTGALAFDVRSLLNEAIKAGPFTRREDLAVVVSGHAGRTVTKAMIDSWTGASRPHRFPADLTPAFCAALGNTLLLQGLAEAAGCALTESAALIQSRYDQLTLFIRFAKAEQRLMQPRLPLFREADHG